MTVENVKHLKLNLEIAARGDTCDVSCPFRGVNAWECRLFGYLRLDGKNHVRHFYCKRFTKGSDDETVG
jgi:hypothetical protein